MAPAGLCAQRLAGRAGAPGTKPEHARVWLDQIPSLHALPVIAGWGEVEERASEELERALYGETPLNDAIQEAIDRTTDAVRSPTARGSARGVRTPRTT